MVKLTPLNVLHESEITNALYVSHLEEIIGSLIIERNDMSDSILRHTSYIRRIKNLNKIIQTLELLILDMRTK